MDRVTLAIVDDDSQHPMLARDPDGAVWTLVVVWPTGPDGHLDVRAVREGKLEVRRWLLTEADVTQLRTVGRSWNLNQHDVLISDRRIEPCSETLRHHRSGLWPGHMVEAARQRLGC